MDITTKPILWIYKEIKDNEKNLVAGEHEVRIRMTQNRVRTYMATGFSSSPENWDAKKDSPTPNHPRYKDLTAKIDKLVDDINFEIKLAEKAGRVISPTEIKTNLTASIKIVPTSEKPNKIRAYTQMVIDKYRADENPGYANIFHNCNLTLKKLLKNQDKMFLAFTLADHEAYEKQISTNTQESTISNYLRTYYRIWNLAISDGLVTKDHHPKQYIKFKAYKRIRTKKRSIKADYWKRILSLKPAKETRIYRSHLMMQFMYYARGMNFNDMLKLKWEHIENRGVAYKRSKNKRAYDFELHPKAARVLDLFRDHPGQAERRYL